MTYEIEEDHSEEVVEEIETVHDELATEHGRNNVFVTAVDGEIVSAVGHTVGIIDPLEITIEGSATSAT